jgi:hypothetical protein
MIQADGSGQVGLGQIRWLGGGETEEEGTVPRTPAHTDRRVKVEGDGAAALCGGCRLDISQAAIGNDEDMI